jgi:hypothetical protein
VGEGTLRPSVSDVLPVQSFAQGLHRVARREVTGRIVLAL